ncbi:hypothetical protein [Paraclostridium dentum]
MIKIDLTSARKYFNAMREKDFDIALDNERYLDVSNVPFIEIDYGEIPF